MRHLAAFLLLLIGGNTTPTEEDITTLLSKAGIEVDSERLTQLLTDLEGKDVSELIALGRSKLSAAGGGGKAAASTGAVAAAATEGAPAAAEKPKEKPKEEEVDALDGGMDMFGGGAGGGDY
jgi:ribosomal protein L12E/L44/L45/RPP1/RPP2